jgi:hypothetical protein
MFLGKLTITPRIPRHDGSVIAVLVMWLCEQQLGFTVYQHTFNLGPNTWLHRYPQPPSKLLSS